MRQYQQYVLAFIVVTISWVISHEVLLHVNVPQEVTLLGTILVAGVFTVAGVSAVAVEFVIASTVVVMVAIASTLVVMDTGTSTIVIVASFISAVAVGVVYVIVANKQHIKIRYLLAPCIIEAIVLYSVLTGMDNTILIAGMFGFNFLWTLEEDDVLCKEAKEVAVV